MCFYRLKRIVHMLLHVAKRFILAICDLLLRPNKAMIEYYISRYGDAADIRMACFGVNLGFLSCSTKMCATL